MFSFITHTFGALIPRNCSRSVTKAPFAPTAPPPPAPTAPPPPRVRHDDVPDEIWITLGVCVGVIGFCTVGYLYCGRKKGNDDLNIQLIRLPGSPNTHDDDEVLLDLNADRK